VVLRGDGAVLMADRPAGKPYPGYWEFPGGKIEPGESVHAALARELFEELGIRVVRSWPWVTLDHEYPHAHVRLHFRRVPEWQGTPEPREGQRLLFLREGDAHPQPLLPAAVPALRWAGIPGCIAIAQVPLDTATAAARTAAAIERGLRILAAPLPREGESHAAWSEVLAFARARSVRLLGLSSYAGVDCDGLLVPAAALRGLVARPAGALAGAMVGNRADLAHAGSLGLDFAVAMPGVGLRALCPDAPLPVLASGAEPAIAALRDAWAAGAHGLCAAW
jgi:8-oxo-dGTP diphosphatase